MLLDLRNGRVAQGCSDCVFELNRKNRFLNEIPVLNYCQARDRIFYRMWCGTLLAFV